MIEYDTTERHPTPEQRELVEKIVSKHVLLLAKADINGNLIVHGFNEKRNLYFGVVYDKRCNFKERGFYQSYDMINKKLLQPIYN